MKKINTKSLFRTSVFAFLILIILTFLVSTMMDAYYFIFLGLGAYSLKISFFVSVVIFISAIPVLGLCCLVAEHVEKKNKIDLVKEQQNVLLKKYGDIKKQLFSELKTLADPHGEVSATKLIDELFNNNKNPISEIKLNLKGKKISSEDKSIYITALQLLESE